MKGENLAIFLQALIFEIRSTRGPSFGLFPVAMALKYAMACLSLVGLEAKRAFIIVDTQECFLENGSLPVVASQIIPKLNEIRNQKDCLFDIVVKTQEGQFNIGT